MRTIEEVMQQDVEALLKKVVVHGRRSTGGSCYISFSGEIWNWFRWSNKEGSWNTWDRVGDNRWWWRKSTPEEATLAEMLAFPDAPPE